MTTLLGAGLYSAKLSLFRHKVFIYLNNFNIVVCSLSFILWSLGIHNGQQFDEVYNQLRPDFAGLYNHSMTLGPMSAIAVLYGIYIFDRDKGNFFCIVVCLLTILCFLSCVKSGSRSALLGLIISVPFFYFKISKGKVFKLFLFIALLIIILVIAFPLYEAYTEQLFGKFSNSENEGSITASRDIKWKARIDEFIDSPIFGVGYANSTHEKIGKDGQIEPGSSWLAILSMTGISGFLIFIIYYLKSFVLKIKYFNLTKVQYFKMSVVLLLSIYMVFEGVIMLAGTLMSAMIWLSLGTTTTIKKE
jgi:O-antigen ligase